MWNAISLHLYPEHSPQLHKHNTQTMAVKKKRRSFEIQKSKLGIFIGLWFLLPLNFRYSSRTKKRHIRIHSKHSKRWISLVTVFPSVSFVGRIIIEWPLVPLVYPLLTCRIVSRGHSCMRFTFRFILYMPQLRSIWCAFFSFFLSFCVRNILRVQTEQMLSNESYK